MEKIKACEVLIELKYYAEDLQHYSSDEVKEAIDEAINSLIKQKGCEDIDQRSTF